MSKWFSKPMSVLVNSNGNDCEEVVSPSFAYRDITGGTAVSAAVPEPAALGILCAGGLALLGRRRRASAK